ncbi:pyridoxamine 5'-phosphate oxidase family protein [Streptomyces indicus]|uniref:Nitroimidazol reductase NimA, pyridoxamine 5'-phosphate oxidase superfamily n=1 Tax=Streptomyces indicus TaxID=417292 RepID=A0A1G9HJI2_9ACTN|nr:pyridoxamine 5'-phosphate oxidase family protein [Streptomyces indicus]SDL13107.1 Nitroimidazol reductase NimA, pyridoxamine 5'-phosphate oxidase superfamily [Streptomyces indicus]
MALTREEREQFLAEPHVAALSVDAGDGRAPLTVPVWYQYAPGGDIWIHTGKGSRKHQLIEKAGRLTLMIDRVQPSVRYVSVEGPVVSTGPAGREHVLELATRYMPPEKVEGYVAYAEANHGESVIITVRPERWVSSDLGSF